MAGGTEKPTERKRKPSGWLKRSACPPRPLTGEGKLKEIFAEENLRVKAHEAMNLNLGLVFEKRLPDLAFYIICSPNLKEVLGPSQLGSLDINQLESFPLPTHCSSTLNF